jgi:hypothetical protein
MSISVVNGITFNHLVCFVGPARIELALNAPHALVLPVYYGPRTGLYINSICVKCHCGTYRPNVFALSMIIW